jgi:hypothetical protein
MNHLEQLVAEWLQYRGYFVRTSVQVGPRANGGFEGELDVVALNLKSNHLIHVECSLDSLSWEKRNEKFLKKFERGKKYIKNVFDGLVLPDEFDQVAILQFATDASPTIDGKRLMTVKQFTLETLDGLKDTSPATGAVPSTSPLLRTLQLAAAAKDATFNGNGRLIPL